jgi:hypothetical protein
VISFFLVGHGGAPVARRRASDLRSPDPLQWGSNAHDATFTYTIVRSRDERKVQTMRETLQGL